MLRWWLLVVLTGCGAAATAERARIDDVPPSDRDPVPFTPDPEPAGATGRTVALAAAGGEDQARQLLPALVIAIRDADEPRLESLFAEEVGSAQARAGDRGQPRAAIVQRILIHARRAILQPDQEVDALLELGAVRVARAAHFWEGRALPGEVRGTDIVVEVPVREEGRGPLRTLLNWQMRGQIVVRPGRDPRIVAY